MLTIARERAPKRKRQERRLRIILRRIRSGFSCREEGAEGAILELQIRGRRRQPQLRNALPWPGIARNQLAFRPVLDGMSAVATWPGMLVGRQNLSRTNGLWAPARSPRPIPGYSSNGRGSGRSDGRTVGAMDRDDKRGGDKPVISRENTRRENT